MSAFLTSYNPVFCSLCARGYCSTSTLTVHNTQWCVRSRQAENRLQDMAAPAGGDRKHSKHIAKLEAMRRRQGSGR
eukprot:scaffold21650_cov21-Tisochrysis_lutea.AAC.1